MSKSNIAWTESTLNLSTGCTQISPGCAHCYAKTLAHRLKAMGQPRYANEFKLTLQPDMIDRPLQVKKPTLYFVDSMSDFFHDDIDLDYIHRCFDMMNKAHWHTFQILTKRHERLAWLAHDSTLIWTDNIWQGVSIENNRFVERADSLRKVPAKTRFLSCEPLLSELTDLNLEGISWVITGGESGPKHRPLNLDHARHLRDKCIAANIPFFFKQIGGATPKSGGDLLDGVEWKQMPERNIVYV